MDYKDRISFNKHVTSLNANGLFQWGNVHWFECFYGDITGFEGVPKECGTFYCDYCNNLKSLVGTPKICRYFSCSCCNNLKSLEGCPDEVLVNFDCSGCINLTSLKGIPEKIPGFFDCSCCKSLKSLNNGPKKVGNYFNCEECGTQFTEEDVKKICDVKGDIFC